MGGGYCDAPQVQVQLLTVLDCQQDGEIVTPQSRVPAVNVLKELAAALCAGKPEMAQHAVKMLKCHVRPHTDLGLVVVLCILPVNQDGSTAAVKH